MKMLILFTIAGVTAFIAGAGLAASMWPVPRADVNAILVAAPCGSSVPVLIFTHRDGSYSAVTPGAPPSPELISRIERTKRSQINLPCIKETLR